jgi:uncharacterized protein (DUF58 family)
MVLKKVAPLHASFMLLSILGLIISLFYITKASLNFGLAFGLVFFLMFIASVISMTRASPDAQLAAVPIIEPLSRKTSITRKRRRKR